MSEGQASPPTNNNTATTAATTSPQQPRSPGMPLPMNMPPENRTSPAREHGPPPPGRPDYSYGGYPPYSPYPPPYPYGYPGPPPPHYPSGAAGYAPPPPYAYPPPPYSRYPSQQPSNSNNSKQPQSTNTNDSNIKRRKSPVRKSPQKSKKASPTNSSSNSNNVVAEDIEMERMRAAAEPMQVAPMRSDFHFFMDDQRDAVETQVKKEEYDGDDKYLLFSNMNARIMKLWEDATTETRASYMTKEEDDRKRFMSEDEIASRHCATLTARAKSPRKDSEQQLSVEEGGESPPKKIKVEEATANCNDDGNEGEEEVKVE